MISTIDPHGTPSTKATWTGEFTQMRRLPVVEGESDHGESEGEEGHSTLVYRSPRRLPAVGSKSQVRQEKRRERKQFLPTIIAERTSRGVTSVTPTYIAS